MVKLGTTSREDVCYDSHSSFENEYGDSYRRKWRSHRYLTHPLIRTPNSYTQFASQGHRHNYSLSCFHSSTALLKHQSELFFCARTIVLNLASKPAYGKANPLVFRNFTSPRSWNGNQTTELEGMIVLRGFKWNKICRWCSIAVFLISLVMHIVPLKFNTIRILL